MRIAAVTLAAAVFALAGCNGPASYATQQVDIFHQRLNSGDYESIWRDSGPDVQNSITKEGFIQMLATVHDRLGAVKDTKQTSWKSNMDTTGSLAELKHHTTFERGAGEEEFVYKGSGNGQKLAGYHIKSDTLMTQ